MRSSVGSGSGSGGGKSWLPLAIRGILLAGGLLFLVLLFNGRAVPPAAVPAPTWTSVAPAGQVLGGVAPAGPPAVDNSAALANGLLAITNQISALQRDVHAVQDALAHPVTVPAPAAAPAVAPPAAPSPCPPTAAAVPAESANLRGAAAPPPSRYPAMPPARASVPENPLVPIMGPGTTGYPLDGRVVMVQSSQLDYKGERFIMFVIKDDTVSQQVLGGGWEPGLIDLLDYVLRTDPNVHDHAVVSD